MLICVWSVGGVPPAHQRAEERPVRSFLAAGGNAELELRRPDYVEAANWRQREAS